MYDPTIGRFLSKDPSGLGPDENPFRYVGNNPTNWNDPDGREAVNINGINNQAINEFLELLDPEVHYWWTANTVLGTAVVGDPAWWFDTGVTFTASNRPVFTVVEGLTDVEIALQIVKEARGGDLFDAFNQYMCNNAAADDKEVDAFIKYRAEAFERAVAQAALLAELYLQGVLSLNPGADAVTSVNDVSQGQYSALASFAAVIPGDQVYKLIARFRWGDRLINLSSHTINRIVKMYGSLSPQNIIAYLQETQSLKRNLIKAGITQSSKTHRAHHIVARTCERFDSAERARELMERLGGQNAVNSAFNGVWLPRRYHELIHTQRYYDEVWRRIRNATTWNQIAKELDRIRQELMNQTFTIR